MKNISIILLSVALATTMFSCSKQQSHETVTPSGYHQVPEGIKVTNLKRDAQHLHDISVSDANQLILNYRTYAGMSDQDSFGNVLTYDISAVREYVNNPNATKFHVILAYENNHVTAVLMCSSDGAAVLNPRNMLLEHSDQWCPMCKCCKSYLSWDGQVIPTN